MVCRLTSASAPPCSLLLLSSGPAVRPASEETSAAALEVWSQVFMRCEENRYSPQPFSCLSWGWGILFKPQRKILVYEVLWLEKCRWNWPIPPFSWGKLSQKVLLLNTALHGWVLYMQRDEWSTAAGSEVRHNPVKKRLALSLQFSSFTCIIHVTPTNYLGLAPSKCQNSEDLLDSAFSLLYHVKYTVI